MKIRRIRVIRVQWLFIFVFLSYETVIGLEVHAQLATRTKLFSNERTVFGAEPNSQVSTITLAHPGTLPRLNRKAVEFALRMGLACGCGITRLNYFSRKNYFYPDLPKGFQVTQHSTPICTGGTVVITVGGEEKQIHLHHIHLEEDAGKSIHDNDDRFTSIDFNRAGTPLIEIVTEPCLQSGEEAYQLLFEIRRLVRWLGICDGNMEAGSLRCDANISVRKKGEATLGTKVEIKNLNSMRFVRDAIGYEAARLESILSSGGTVMQETRSFDERSGATRSSREKEDAHDYRYFPEPDLPPFRVTDKQIDNLRKTLPELPRERMVKYTGSLGLSVYDGTQLTLEKETSDYFEEMTRDFGSYKAAANWLLGPVRSWLNANGRSMAEFPVSPKSLAKLVALVENDGISFSTASTRLLPELIRDPSADPEQVAVAKDLLKQQGDAGLEDVVEEVLRNFAAKVDEYRKGKKGLLALFVGEAMKRTRGQADPKRINELILKKINAQ